MSFYQDRYSLAPSSVNFCERDFEVTPYVGEWMNFLSSGVLVGLGLLGAVKTQRSARLGEMRPIFVTLRAAPRP